MNTRPDKSRILILGVTAVGKGTLAFELAKHLHAQIISVDSMKVYRRMDIGTAKPSAPRRQEVPYHLLDVIEPSDSFSVDRFLELAGQAAERIRAAGKPVIASGGTAMYIKSMLYGLFDGPACDPQIRKKLKAEIQSLGLAELHKRMAAIDPAAGGRIHPNDEKRIIRALEVYELTGKPISDFQQQWSGQSAGEWFVVGLRREKEEESKRINLRVKRMIEQGLLDEVKSLLAEPTPLSRQARMAIGYAEMIEHLEGKLSLDEAIEKIKINTRKLAKAQRTWFKTFRDVNWITIAPETQEETVLKETLSLLS